MIERFIPLRHPDAVFFAGEEKLSYFALAKNRVVRRQEFAPFVPGDAASLAAAGIAGAVPAIAPGPAALVLPPAAFIFNVFEFDRLPWPQKTRRELIRWKLEKVFPENLDLYRHHFAVLGRRTVLSILLRRSVVEQCQEAFATAGWPLIEIACSTAAAAAALLPRRRCPDLWLESDGHAHQLFVAHDGRPVYIRKFRSGDVADAVSEIARTVQYVTGNYGIQPRTFQLLALEPGQAAPLREALLSSGLAERPLRPGRLLTLPTAPWSN